MKSIDSTLLARLKSARQTYDANADARLNIWISRPTTALTNSQFLEKQQILAGSSITDVAVAACHPVIYRPVTRIYVGYVDNGTAHVRYATAVTAMKDHIWHDTGFSETASAVALEFNGTMPKDRKGRVEFVTEELPWVFWVNSGVAYGCVLGDQANAVTLASANATDVFAVRGMWSEVGGFDFGLVLFMVISGQLYYRQLIDGVWMDAENVSSVGGLDLTVLTITSIAAMRTWDYRIVIQIQDSTGAMYEIFTQYMGIGKQNVEHVEMTAEATGGLIAVDYRNTAENEHIEMTTSASGDLIYGLSSVPISVANIDNGSGDYGYVVQVVLDYPVTGVSGNFAAFVLTDSNSVTYTGTAISVSADGLTLTITFPDFNNASGDLTLSYTPGTIQSPATALATFSKTFTPSGLVPTAANSSEVEAIWNE
jgi:hypothetical protein